MNNITYYSFKDISKNITFLNTIEQVNQKIIDNKLYDENLKIEIFFLNNESIYKIYNPLEILPSKNTYAITIGSKVIFKMIDFKKNLVYYNQEKIFPYELDRALIHEVIHTLQMKKIWFFQILYKYTILGQ